MFSDYCHFLRSGEVEFVLRNGAKFKVRTRNREPGLINAVWLDKIYNPPGYEIQEGNIVVDIGAYIGVFSIFAATSANNVKVYGYEPFSLNYSFFKQNIELNGLTNIRPFKIAVSAEAGKKKLYISEKCTQGNSLYADCLSQQPIASCPEVVDCVTLKDVFYMNGINRIDLLKMDCEGSEYEILFNSPRDILTNIRKIAMEYHEFSSGEHHYCSKELSGFLRKAGFEVECIVPDPRESIGYLYATR